jgi:hypothetical protein
MNLKTEVELRLRLIRKTTYRMWRSAFLARAKPLIANINYPDGKKMLAHSPCIIISSFAGIKDLLIISYVFRDSEIAFIAPEDLPNDSLLNLLRGINQVIFHKKQGSVFVFLREIMTTLTKYNRSLVICPEAINSIAPNASINPAVVIRLAMKASIPITPVNIIWKKVAGFPQRETCDVFIGKRIFISPRTDEFRAIFFGRRGARKFEKLTNEELLIIWSKISAKLIIGDRHHGANLS